MLQPKQYQYCFLSSAGAVWKALDRSSRDHQFCVMFPQSLTGNDVVYRYLNVFCFTLGEDDLHLMHANRLTIVL